VGNVIASELADDLIQPWWTAWMAMRWGFGDWCCHLWAATGLVMPQTWRRLFGGIAPVPIEVVIIYRELLVQGTAESELANQIVSMTPVAERKHISRFYLGSESLDTHDKKGRQNGVREIIGAILTRNKLTAPQDADLNRVEGWRFLYSCLRQAQMTEMDVIPAERVKEGPVLLVSKACPGCIESIPLATRSDKSPEDVEVRPMTEWAAVADAARFLLKGKPSPRAEAPVNVRRQELAESIADPTARHMAIVRFNERERQRGNAHRPSWRS
jgi:hypothetical protein